MYLVQRAGSPFWYISYTEGRRSKLKSTGTPDYPTAELDLARFRRDHQGGSLSVGELLSLWFDEKIKDTAQAERVIYALIHLRKRLGNLSPLRADPGSYARARVQEGASPGTVNRELAALRSAYRYVLPTPPAVPALPASPPRERVLSRSEAARLLRQLRTTRARLFFRLAIYTGARPSSIMDLTWDRVDFENGIITYALPGRSQTRKRRATVPFMGALARALRFAHARRTCGHVIEFRGRPVRSLRLAIERAAKRANLPGVTRYVLRHTAATQMARAKVPLGDIAEMLGHSDLRTTRRYIKYRPDFLRDAAYALLRDTARQNPMGAAQKMVELIGVEPTTSAVR